ncbi:MAG: VPLPA-CTERM sorting domain-containing protein [Paracoccaceae bacterium]
MNRLSTFLIALAASFSFSNVTNAATVTLVASDSLAFVAGADLNGDLSDGFEAVEVGITGFIDSEANAPGVSPLGSELNWSFIFDPIANAILSGTYSITNYLNGSITAGSLSFPATPPTPVLSVTSGSHFALSFDPAIIDGDLSFGLAFPNGDVSNIATLTQAIAGSPISVTTAIVFDTTPVPLPAGGLFLLGGVGAFAGFRRLKRRA